MGAGRKLRVLHLIPDLGKGGAERFTIGLCRALSRRDDVEVVLGTLYSANAYAEDTVGLRVVDVQHQTHSMWRPRAQEGYRSLLAAFDPDVIHTHLFLAEFLSASFLRPQTAYVCHGHDNMFQFAPPAGRALVRKQTWLRMYERHYLARRKYARVTTHFVANSEHTRDFYTRVLPPHLRPHVQLLPYGFEYERFHRAVVPLEPRGPLRLVNVGSFQEKKNQALIVAIAGELAKAGRPFEIDLVGDGVTRPAVERLVLERGLEAHVRFRGNVSDVERWLWQSHVYLHTARYEPFGLVFLEAMAAGLPIVALDGGGNRDVIRDGVNGFLIGEERPELFASRIQEVGGDPDLHRRLATSGQEFARSYDMPARAEEFVRFYRRIVSPAIRAELPPQSGGGCPSG